jgi:hypothetical protein
LQEAALAIEVLEALNVHHKVQDFETSQDELLYVLLTTCSDLRVHGMHGFEEVNNQQGYLVVNLCSLLLVRMEYVFLVSLIQSVQLKLNICHLISADPLLRVQDVSKLP